jgi:RHS repeat-associated protein
MEKTRGSLGGSFFLAFVLGIACCSTAVWAGALSYQTNKDGLIKSITYPNGMVSNYEYDSLNRLVRLTHRDACNVILARYDYTHYADGQLESATEYDGTKIQWQYDNLNRLIKEDCNAPGTNNDYIHSYIYDLVGNRLELRKPEDANVSYFYDIKTDRLTQLTAGDVSKFYYYDDNGSLIKETDDSNTLRTFSYDLEGRLSTVENVGSNTITYKYDSTGYRIEKEINGDNTVEFLIDTENPTGYPQVFQEITDTDKTTYVIGKHIVGQVKGQGDFLYYLYDGMGSVRHLVDGNCTILESYYYDAYGNMLDRSTAEPTSKLLYRGQWWDKDIKMYYLQSRYYDPATGLFNRMDEHPGNKEEPQSLHKYVYCQDDPINKIDPTGMSGVSVQEPAVTIAIGAETIGLSSIATGVIHNSLKNSNIGYVRQVAKQEIELFIQTAPDSVTSFDLTNLENRIRARTRSKDKEPFYLHYGFQKDRTKFYSGMVPNSWVTRDVYPTGWHAKMRLAQNRYGPRDAVYFVLPDRKIVGPTKVTSEKDEYIKGLLLPGGGEQYKLPFGSSPGTVIGPLTIPEGQLR